MYRIDIAIYLCYNKNIIVRLRGIDMEQFPSKFLTAFSVLFPQDASSPHTLAQKIPKEIKHSFFIQWNAYLRQNICQINERLRSDIYQNDRSRQRAIDIIEIYEVKPEKDVDDLSMLSSFQTAIQPLLSSPSLQNEAWLYNDIAPLKKINCNNFCQKKTHTAINVFLSQLFSPSTPDCLRSISEEIVDVFHTYIPNLWNAYLYTYVYNEHPSSPQAHIYSDIALSFLVMDIHEKLQPSESSTSPSTEEYIKHLKQYFSEHGKFNKKAEEIIFHPFRSKSQRCRESTSKITLSLLVYFSIVYLKTREKTDIKNFIKKLGLDATQFSSLITPTKDASSFPNISQDELFFANELFSAIPTQKKPRLCIFSLTEKALSNQQAPNRVCEEALAKIDALKKQAARNEEHCAMIAEQLAVLLRFHESISDEFHLNLSPKMLKKIDPKATVQDYIIELLCAYEQDFIQRKEKDIWFSQVLQAQEYDTLKFAWQVEKAPSYDSVILAIYQDIQDKIALVFSKKALKRKEDPRCQYTESDLEQALTTHAFDSSLPDKQNPMWELIQGTSLLTLNGTFKNEEVKFVCAGIYFANQFGIGAIDEIKTQYICYIRALIEKTYDHTSHIDFFCKNGVTFGAIALLLMPPKTRYLLTSALCQELNDNMYLSAGKQRALYQTLTLILTLLLSEAKTARLPSDLTIQVMNTVFGRTFYPQFMDILKTIKATPFHQNHIEQQFDRLKTPILQNGLFPSPFYLYFYAGNITPKSGTKIDFFELKNRNITLKEDVKPLQTSLQCYEFCLELVGATWRVIHKTQSIKFDMQIFSCIQDSLCTLWNDAKLQDPCLDLLYLVWSTHLLLIAVSNLARANQYPDEDQFQQAIPAFIKIGMLADVMQRKYNGEYRSFIKSSVKTRNDFWLISGLHRYVSVLQDKENDMPASVYFDFTERNDMISLYEDALTAELQAGNYRFYILLCRNLEEYSNFYDHSANCVPPNKQSLDAMEITFKSFEETFLPYDNLEPYLEKILSR